MSKLGFVAFTLSPLALFALLHLEPPPDAPAYAARTSCRVVTARHPVGDLEVRAEACFGGVQLAAR